MATSYNTLALRIARKPSSVWLNTDFYQDEIIDAPIPHAYEESFNQLASGLKRFYQKGDGGFGQVSVTFRIRKHSETLQKLKTLRDYIRSGTDRELYLYPRWQEDESDYRIVYLQSGQIPDSVSAHGYDKSGYELTVTFDIIDTASGVFMDERILGS